MNDQIEKSIFLGRWTLAPLYFGLALTIFVYTIRFFVELWHLVLIIVSAQDSEILLKVLHLVDIVMVCHLIVMVQIGGFALFIRKLAFLDEQSRLQWLDHLDPGTLKIKMSMSLIGVSSIQLLEAFVNASEVSGFVMAKLVIVHMVFVISTIAIAAVRRMIH